MALQDTKNRKFLGEENGFNVYEITVKKGEREDVIKVNVPANPKAAEQENEDYWALFERQYLADASNHHRSTGMISEEERKAKLQNQVQRLKDQGMSEKDILELLKD